MPEHTDRLRWIVCCVTVLQSTGMACGVVRGTKLHLNGLHTQRSTHAVPHLLLESTQSKGQVLGAAAQ